MHNQIDPRQLLILLATAPAGLVSLPALDDILAIYGDIMMGHQPSLPAPAGTRQADLLAEALDTIAGALVTVSDGLRGNRPVLPFETGTAEAVRRIGEVERLARRLGVSR